MVFGFRRKRKNALNEKTFFMLFLINKSKYINLQEIMRGEIFHPLFLHFKK
jgi:hypothetical protein